MTVCQGEHPHTKSYNAYLNSMQVCLCHNHGFVFNCLGHVENSEASQVAAIRPSGRRHPSALLL